MDPERCRTRMIETARSITKRADDTPEDEMSREELEWLAGEALELAGYVEALDEWIKKGGYLPLPWVKE